VFSKCPLHISLDLSNFIKIQNRLGPWKFHYQNILKMLNQLTSLLFIFFIISTSMSKTTHSNYTIEGTFTSPKELEEAISEGRSLKPTENLCLKFLRCCKFFPVKISTHRKKEHVQKAQNDQHKIPQREIH